MLLSKRIDRERAMVWGIYGNLPSISHERNGSNDNEWLASVFSEGRYSDAVIRRDGEDARVVNHYPEDWVSDF